MRVAIVTGASSGIGRRVAMALVADGFHVAAAARRADALQETANMTGDRSESVIAVPTDVRDADSVRQLFARTVEAFGRIDLLFNNAGISAPSVPFDQLTLEQWQACIDVNLTGAFLCAREAFRQMKSQNPMGGRIINNGSISAQVPRPKSAPYTASKHAITGLTRSISLDGRAFNVACGQIDIGNAATDMTDRMQQGVPQANGTIAVEPTMDADNVARAVVYMASLPLDANVQFMTVMATNMPYIGRG